MPNALLPTRRAVLLIVVATPLALLIGVIAPQAWAAIPAAGIALLGLLALDAVLAGQLRDAQVELPVDCEIGEGTPLRVTAQFAKRPPAEAQAALALDDKLAEGGRAILPLPHAQAETLSGEVTLIPTRRGTTPVTRLWIGWEGPLGLARWQHRRALDQAVRIWPDLSPVRSPALQNFLRDARIGLIARRIRGDGSQFESMTEYQPGMDRRRIDWKSSARHVRLNAREYETERDNQIVFAFDCGQAMCAPVDGLPRIDRAVSAALANAFVALKGGDRVALFGFAARPQVFTPFIADSRAFGRLQAAAASLDYTLEEPNFTLALATLSGRLQRRSLIILFSDFTDPTGAEIMIENITRLMERHRVIFVTIADSELDDLVRQPPRDMEAIAASVGAHSLSQQRALVLSRLRHLGVDIVEAPWRKIGFALLDRYMAIKQGAGIG